MTDQTQEQPDRKKTFYWFENHGDDEGNNAYTICYGNEEEDNENAENFIVGCEDTEEDANEACRRLNSIVEPIRASLSEERQRNEELKKENEQLKGIEGHEYWRVRIRQQEQRIEVLTKALNDIDNIEDNSDGDGYQSGWNSALSKCREIIALSQNQPEKK